MSEQKVIVAGWYTVDPKRRDEVVENFKDLVLRARSAPGCLDFAITADPVDSNRINNFEFWQSEKDLSVHEMSSEAKRRETVVSGCKGPSVHGRNLGTSAQSSSG
jgi:quinol monooxygenase YgiN